MSFKLKKTSVFLMMTISIIVFFSCSENSITEPDINPHDPGLEFFSIEEFRIFVQKHDFMITFLHDFLRRNVWYLEVDYVDFRDDLPFVDLTINEQEINAYVHNCRCTWLYSFLELIGSDLKHGQEISMNMTTEKGTTSMNIVLPDKPLIQELPKNLNPEDDFFIEWELSHDSDVQILSVVVEYLTHNANYRKIIKGDIRSYTVPANTFPEGKPSSYRVYIENYSLMSINNDLIIGYANTVEDSNLTP
ncbi:MAG: hypothetical protein FWG98_05670 [Candidatus Cloacimonetes bacterium]|nr:hypothetical protein [Candidatus Cloacimonadota bacterium]